jgi:trimethylamine:corrinoid methyltransferase-like protein
MILLFCDFKPIQEKVRTMNKKNAVRIFSHEDILKVHQATVTILREIGVFIADGDTRKLLRQKGCKETASGYLSFDEKIVDEALNLVPSQLLIGSGANPVPTNPNSG